MCIRDSFRSDVGHVHAISGVFDCGLTDRPALLCPKLLHKFGAANLDQLEALQVRGFWQENISEVIGLVIGICERDYEGELGDPFGHFRRIP